LSTGEIGVLAMGSHRERHGAVLPEDTDAKLAAHVALEAAKRTGAKFLGMVHRSYELPGIDTGVHNSLEEAMKELKMHLRSARDILGIRAAVIVNGHGGNNPIQERIHELERDLGMHIIFNIRLIELEGPHAGTGEASMGAAVGIADEGRLKEHCDFKKHPEVGFVGLREARRLYSWAEEHAMEVEAKGVRVDREAGARMVEEAIRSVLRDIELLSEG